ncbi:Zinc finger protein zas1 [Cytospora mali]|uniref:Zinc finger protein zas1 n=1 Tax=Cytospora mali TaxID=578113 RepID=A0A194UPF3_CYTMA|nr:Zinc finger protein zas1 [Valsa mali var. pyri (nom. inval.)]
MDIRDLLVRHEKLVHLSDGNKDGSATTVSHRRKSSAANVQSSPTKSHGDTEMLGMQQTPSQPHFASDAMSAVVSTLSPDSRIAPRPAPACNLDLLSDAATHLASAGDVSSMQPLMSDINQPQPGLGRVDGMASYADRSRDSDPVVYSTQFPATTAPYAVSSAPFAISSNFPVTSAGFPVSSNPQPSLDANYDFFLDDFGTQSHFLPAGVDTEQNFGGWRGGTSSFPSRFPSLAPEASTDGAGRLPDEGTRAPLWRISGNDHGVIKSRLDEFSSVLPSDFVFPSRHTLTRYLEGYISGFQEHLPFLHIPTLNPIEIAPELLLAMASVGAQYRFESHRGHALWYAAKAVALEQIRRRHSHEVHTLLPTPAAYSPHSTRASPSPGFRHSYNSVHLDRPMTQETHREPYSPNNPQSRLETIQALLLLFSVGLWGAKAILQDALSLQSQLALLIRDERLSSSPTQTNDWETWVRNEGSNRTKLIAFCYFNLCSIAYNSPPVLFTSETNLLLPGPSRLWRAESAWAWRDARPTVTYTEITLQDALTRLLQRPSQGPLNNLSSLGNYVLIHALIQHIYLLKQTSFAHTSPFDIHRGLKADDVEEVAQALRVWQMGFEEHRLRITQSAQQMGSENFPGGPVSFDATALSRLAHIRLHTDLVPARALESREPYAAANIFNNLPLLPRGPRLNKAILQAVHALSMLVKAGINYIARTKSLEWSMQHSLCNLECAVLLAKWLMTMASLSPTEVQTGEEKTILASIRTIVDETEYAVPIDPSLAAQQPSRIDGSLNDSQKLRQLASAVLRIWAKTFKGEHIFELVKNMGHGLEVYSNILDKPRDQPSLGRMSSGSMVD